TFTLRSMKDLSSEAAYAGKPTRDEAANAKAQETDVEGDGGKDRSESRSLTLTAKGDLVLHGVRLELSAPIRALFHYPDKAAPDRAPDRLKLETHRPISVLLKLFDIQPRNTAGVLIAEDTKLFGSKVGTEAKLTFSISASLKSAP